MSTGMWELVTVIIVALLLFGPAVFLAWGGYVMGRRKGREEGAAEARAEMTPAAEAPSVAETEPTGEPAEDEVTAEDAPSAEEEADE